MKSLFKFNIYAFLFFILFCVNNSSATAITVEVNNLSVFVDVVGEIDCNSTENAEVLINVAGGSGAYVVVLDNNSPVSEISAGLFSAMLMSGSYEITITDANDGCSLVDNFAVGQPSPILIEVEITEVDDCSGRILNADISGSGGTPPYTIETNPMSDGLEVTVMDNAGCSETVFVENPPLENALIFSSIQIFDSEGNADDGSIDITIQGGNPPYVYEWVDNDNNVLSTEEDIEDLAPGIYSVKVSDSRSCTILSGELEVDQITSVSSVADQKIIIYPNPNNVGYFIISGETLANKSYSILNSIGEVVIFGILTDNYNYIGTAKLENGIYFFRILGDNGFYKLKRLVISK